MTADASAIHRSHERGEPFWLSFKSKGPSFTRRLHGSPVIASKEGQLRDYAITLRELAASGQYEPLSSHFQPRIEDYAKALGLSADEAGIEFRADLERFRNVILEPATRSLVKITSHCGGRLCELGLLPDLRLIGGYVPPTPTNRIALRVVVAEVDGELRVVR